MLGTLDLPADVGVELAVADRTWMFESLQSAPGLDLAIVDKDMAAELAAQADMLVSLWGTPIQGNPPDPAPRWLITHRRSIALFADDAEYDHDGYIAMKPEQIQRLLEFARKRGPFQGRLLVHCAQGISRSSACALALLADRLGPGEEVRAAQALLEATRKTSRRGWREDSIRPNATIVRLTDELLDRNGALMQAVDDVLFAKKTLDEGF